MHDYKPKIIAFCCEYCGYAAADMAGSLRLEYPANIKIVKLPCTGRVDVLTVLKAFENGADGVLVFGCLEGNCHFELGNLRAKKRIAHVRQLLRECGIEEERVAMFNTSASMGVQFARYATQATEKIIELGPSPVNKKMKHAVAATVPQMVSSQEEAPTPF